MSEPNAIPDALLHVPGLLDDLTECSMRYAHRPSRLISFAGSLALLSFLASRRYCSEDGCYPNIYEMLLADPGSGKEHPRSFNGEICAKLGLAHNVIDNVTSGEGLEDELLVRAKLLLQRDELDTLFQKFAKDKSGASEALVGRLLALYGAANLNRRAKAASSTPITDRTPKTCCRPQLTIFGTGIRGRLVEAIDRRVMENGLLARFIVFDVERRGEYQRPSFAQIDKGLVERLSIFHPRNGDELVEIDGRKPPHLSIVYSDDEGERALEESALHFDALYDAATDIHDTCTLAVWSRAQEKVTKLAMIYAISGNTKEPEITAAAVAWAREMVERSSHLLLGMAGDCAKSEDDKTKDNIIKQIRKGLNRPREIMQYAHLKVKVFNEHIADLLARGDIVDVSNGQRKEFVLAEDA